MSKSEQIIKRLNDTTKPDLVINKAPASIVALFKKFAEEEFCNHYGLCLKHVLDFYFGLIPKGTEPLEYELSELKRRFEEHIKKDEEPKPRKRLDGSTKG